MKEIGTPGIVISPCGETLAQCDVFEDGRVRFGMRQSTISESWSTRAWLSSVLMLTVISGPDQPKMKLELK